MKPAGVILERWLRVSARVGIGLVNAKSVNVCKCNRFNHRFQPARRHVEIEVLRRLVGVRDAHGCEVSRTLIRISMLQRIVENVLIYRRELSSAR